MTADPAHTPSGVFTPQAAREQISMVNIAITFVGEAISAGLIQESAVLARDNGGRPPSRAWGWWANLSSGADGQIPERLIFVGPDGRIYEPTEAGDGTIRPCQNPFNHPRYPGLTASAVEEALFRRLGRRG